MITQEQAQSLVEAEIEKWATSEQAEPVVVVTSATQETSFGWVFFCQSLSYLETGNISNALAGNAPFLVNRSTGEVTPTGTAQSVEHYIREYEKRA